MKRKQLALATLIIGALFAPAIGNAQGAGTFPSFSPLPLQPEGVAVDKVGNVYVSVGSDESDQIWKFSPSGAKTLLVDFGPPGGGACGLAVDPEGNVYM